MKTLFGTPLLHVSTSLDTEKLYNQIKECRARKGPEVANYTSYFDTSPMEGVDCTELKNHIMTQAKKYCDTVFPTGKYPGLQFENIWWNLYGQGNYHGRHSHGSNFLSGTFYVHMDELSAPLDFHSPIQSLIWGWNSKFGVDTIWSQQVSVYAVAGDLLIWPPWLEHSVPEQKHQSNNPRCTVSFNLKVIKV